MLNEIAIITRAGPARILGLKNKGHLRVGADADITIYTPHDNQDHTDSALKSLHVVSIDDQQLVGFTSTMILL